MSPFNSFKIVLLFADYCYFCLSKIDINTFNHFINHLFMETSIKLYSLKANEIKTYTFAALFVTGNLALPQICHLIPLGGQMLLPIYFFTLIAAYKYGFFTGLITAVASPIINHLLFGMPVFEMLPILLIKSALLATAAAYMAQRTKEVKLTSLLLVILFYQGIGMLAELAITGSMFAAMQDIRLGIAGMLLQLFGGYFCLKALKK